MSDLGDKNKAADKKRRESGLLTGKEIRAMRKRLNLSMRGFAEYLCVGEASIKRWETYYVQDASMDRLMRLMGDLNFAKMHVRFLKKRLKELGEENV